MEYYNKEILFRKFLSKWSEKFNKIPFLLKHLSTYPEIAEKLNGFHYLNIEDLNNSQLEWVSLVAQLDNPIETNFFKDFWVPIQKDGYDYFIDLSSDLLPLFETHYFFLEPYYWYKKHIFKDVSQFLINTDNPNFSIEKHLENLDNERWSEVTGFFDERDELGFAGKIKLGSIEKENLFSEEQNSSFSFCDNCITFSGINSLIVGLLPLDCKITLQDFRAPYNKNSDVCDKVKNIKALVYLLQSVGLLSIDSYLFTFNSDKDCKAEFKDNTFRIVHNDKALLKNMIDKYEIVRNS